MVDWVKRNRESIAEIKILTQSRIFAMTLAVSRLMLGGLVDGYNDAAAFEAELARAVRDRG